MFVVVPAVFRWSTTMLPSSFVVAAGDVGAIACEISWYSVPLLSDRSTSISDDAMSWYVSNDDDAPYAAIHSRSSSGMPACTGDWLNVVPLSVDVATCTDARFRLAT